MRTPRLGQLVLQIVIACLVLLALALAAVASALVWCIRSGLRDKVGFFGNRLLRLLQRLDEAGEKLDAAVRICGEGLQWRR